ncbi:MAG TPA: tetratricopeptide repeat protein, partial [Cytophagaceae bacterium]
MKFKYLALSLSLISAVFFASCVYARNSGEFKSDFDKIEQDYKKGNYKIARHKINSLLKKIEKKQGKENIDISRAYAWQAKVSCALGNFSDYSKEVTLSINTLSLADKTDTINHIITLQDISKAYTEYGDYLNAEKYAREAVEIAEKYRADNADFIADLKVHYAKVLFHQGYLLQAQQLTSEVTEFYEKRLVKKEEVNNPKTGLVEVKKVSSNELRARKREYADILNFYAKSLIEDGDLVKADSVLKAHNKWIKKNLGKKEITYVDNLVLSARLANELGKRKERYLHLDKASKLAGKTKGVKLKPGSNQMLSIYMELIPSYKAVGKHRSAGKKRKQLAARVIRYYGKDNFWYGKYLMLEAKQHLEEESWKKAEDKFENILQSPDYFPEMKLERAGALVLLKEAELKLDKYREAEKNLEEAVKIKKALMGENAPAYHMQLLDLADFHVQYTSKFKVAEEIYAHSLWKVVDKEVGHNHKSYVNYLYNESRLYEYTDRFSKADAVIKKASAEIERYYGKDKYQYAIALEKQANLDIHLGKYLEAEESVKKALSILEKNNAPSIAQHVEKTLETYARLNIIQGQYSEAEKNLKKANRLSKKHGSDNTQLSNVLEELATLYIHIGKYQSTEKSLKESLKNKEVKFGKNHRSLINPLNQLGQLYLITGDYTTAEKMVNRAMEISKGIFGDTSVKYAESLMLLQKIYSAIGDYSKAEEAGVKVVDIKTRQFGRNHILVANALNALALSKFHNKRKKEEVEPLFQESLQIIKNNLSDQHLQYAEVLKNLSMFYIETGRIAEAEENLEKSNKVYVSKLGADNLPTAEINFLKAGIHSGKGEFTNALEFYSKSKDIYARKFDTDHPGYVKALSKVAHMQYILGDLKSSLKTVNETTKIYLTFIDKYFPSLSEREKNRFWNLISNDFEFYSSLTARLKDENPELVGNLYNFALATKALLLNSSIKVRERILNSQDTVLIKKFEDWLGKKELLTSVLSMSIEQRKEEGVDVKILEKEIEQLEKSISEHSLLFARNYERKTKYDWKEIKKNLLPNEIAVEIIRFRYFDKGFTDSIIYAALIVTPESKLSPDIVLMGDGANMEGKYGRNYRNCIKFDVEDKYSYSAYWEPLTKYVKENTKVYLSPDGIYNQLNLEAIPVPGKGYMIDLYEIALVNNSRDIINNKLAQKRKTTVNNTRLQATLFGNPTYYTIDSTGRDVAFNRLSQLPGAEKEVKNLHELLNENGWNATVYLNDDASEEKLKGLESPY